MSDVRLERAFRVSPARLFEVVSSNAGLLQWWGPQNCIMRDQKLDFTQLGPWHAAMVSDEGTLYKMSGRVTKVQPITLIGFTWGWHDEQDERGVESHVTFTVQETKDGAKLIIDHRDLGDDDTSANHEKGWSSSLRKLDALFG
mgnify:CR=1 FL=1